MSDLLTLLNHVPDSYEDFVVGMMSFARSSDRRTKGLRDFLVEQPEATSSKVIEFAIKELGLLADHDPGGYVRSAAG